MIVFKILTHYYGSLFAFVRDQGKSKQEGQIRMMLIILLKLYLYFTLKEPTTLWRKRYTILGDD